MKGYYPETRLDKAVKLWIADDKLRFENYKEWKASQDQKRKDWESAWEDIFSGKGRIGQ